MSKVVTIPKDRNPFVVIVNGVRYSYPAGTTVEVPDAVADVIEKYEGAKPKPDPNAGISSGGSLDWDDIENKPFGDMPTGGDTLYWDGNTEGLVCVADAFYKVSGTVFTAANLENGATVNMQTPGGPVEIPVSTDALIVGNGVISFDVFVFVETDGAIINEIMAFPEAGVYLMSGGGAYVSSLTIPGYTGFPVTKKMEEKYLPGAVILYGDAEYYLYTTEDTSDTNNRMTNTELMDAVMSGRQIYVYSESVEGAQMYMLATMVGLQNGFGVILTNNMVFYTAEYVPETTT